MEDVEDWPPRLTPQFEQPRDVRFSIRIVAGTSARMIETLLDVNDEQRGVIGDIDHPAHPSNASCKHDCSAWTVLHENGALQDAAVSAASVGPGRIRLAKPVRKNWKRFEADDISGNTRSQEARVRLRESKPRGSGKRASTVMKRVDARVPNDQPVRC